MAIIHAPGGPETYLDADERLCSLYAEPDDWARKGILNVAGSGKFSNDRTITGAIGPSHLVPVRRPKM